MFNTNSWLIYGLSSNKFKNTYIQGFLDISGNILLRNGGFSLSNGDVSMNGNLWVQKQSVLIGNVGIGTTTPQSTLDVSGNFILRNGDFTLTNGNISLNGNIFVSQNTIINGDVSMNGNVLVRQKMTFVGDVSMNSNAWVGQKTTLIGDVSMNGNLWVGLDASFNRNVSIKGRTTTNNSIFQIDGRQNLNIASSIGTFPNYGTTATGPNLINIGSSNFDLVEGGLRDTIAIGSDIMEATTPIGHTNIGIGKRIFPSLISGTQNIGIGNTIATSMLGGDNNIFIGNGVAVGLVSGGNIVAIGTNAGTNAGTNCTFLGPYSASNSLSNTNSTAIGYSTTITKSNQIKLGTENESVDISGNLNVSKETVFGSDVLVKGKTTFNNDMSMNGTVGIGIKPSIYALDISGGNALSSSDFNALRINTDRGALTGYGQKILFSNTQLDGSTHLNGEIATYRENSAGNYNYSLRLSSGNNSALRECMRLTGTGYVGIGTTSPQEILDVNGNFALRNGSLRLTNGDVSMNGNAIISGIIRQFNI